MTRSPYRRWATLATLLLTTVALGAVGACGDGSGGTAGASGPVPLRLGYFPNITHAPAIVGVEKGIFAAKLGAGARLETRTFNAGPAAVEAIFSGALDAAYIGPNPTINAFVKSHGQAVRVVSGAASGGVALVVRPGIASAADLRGRRIATPQLGNTQDVALRYWLKQQGLSATKEGGGDVSIVPQENAQTVDTFHSGAVDGAWVPEPYLSRLVDDGGRVLVDERDEWPGGRFVITNLVVGTKFLKAHPDLVKRLVDGQVAATGLINAHPDEAQRAVADHIGTVTGKPLDLALIRQAWPSITFLNDPIAASLKAGLDHAVAVGLSQPADLSGLYDLSYLNEVLAARGEPGVPLP
ncbi:ABC transporter substrate-binding protein [Plantactinospora sp. KBS50]|uniref:ABC transporter substrate-binding protein n=1 Tax=Plantactinospora sp. KBS50 TaxID=2024580 RepID=UPI000BAAD107|nr:ABC transporter substrate-binding protein [Plantactinospora sp. KBS50]ASW56633.1 sulfonate ABC transporter substrate-binding protein [Plantactinospora sp. KBS50]